MNRHAQTITAVLPGPAPFAAERIWIPLSGDAGRLLAYVTWQPASRGTVPAVILVHGIGGSSESRYIARAAAASYGAGFHVVRLNLRGVGAGVSEATTLYHAGLFEDLDVALKAIAASPRVDGVHIIGLSLGGHVALRLAVEWGDAVPPGARTVAAISAPLSLGPASRNLERLAVSPYRWYVMRGLRRIAMAYAQAHPSKLSLSLTAIDRLRSVVAYDDRIVAPMHGFADAQDYYARVSAGPHLHRIRVPSIVVHADDDPVVPPTSVHPFLSQASSAVTIRRTARGGHLGFVEQPLVGGLKQSWAIDRAIAHAKAKGGS